MSQAYSYGATVPRGVVACWFGSLASVPSGWAACDGTNSTPDLRDKFIVSSGVSNNPGDTGGTATHEHEVNGQTGLAAGFSVRPGTSAGSVLQQHSHPITNVPTTTKSNIPPYYCLVWIMKL